MIRRLLWQQVAFVLVSIIYHNLWMFIQHCTYIPNESVSKSEYMYIAICRRDWSHDGFACTLMAPSSPHLPTVQYFAWKWNWKARDSNIEYVFLCAALSTLYTLLLTLLRNVCLSENIYICHCQRSYLVNRFNKIANGIMWRSFRVQHIILYMYKSVWYSNIYIGHLHWCMQYSMI